MPKSPLSRRARLFRRMIGRFVKPDATLEQQREAMDRIDRFPRPKRMEYADITLGGVPAIRATPTEGWTDRHILYLHGGGYAIGSPKSHIAMAATLAQRCLATVTAIDYRLAPEHTYPAAIDDCVAAYRALLDEAAPPSITIAGDSAGGGATLATLGALKDAGDPMPGCAYLLSPWTDLTGSGESMTTKAEADPMLDSTRIDDFAAMYAGSIPLDHPGVSPLFADLSGLPPLLIQAGSDEVLLDDSTRLAERARAAGVQVELEVATGMWHVYQAATNMTPESKRALDRAAIFITAHTLATAPSNQPASA